jgi:hypothetical protein
VIQRAAHASTTAIPDMLVDGLDVSESQQFLNGKDADLVVACGRVSGTVPFRDVPASKGRHAGNLRTLQSHSKSV